MKNKKSMDVLNQKNRHKVGKIVGAWIQIHTNSTWPPHQLLLRIFHNKQKSIQANIAFSSSNKTLIISPFNNNNNNNPFFTRSCIFYALYLHWGTCFRTRLEKLPLKVTADPLVSFSKQLPVFPTRIKKYVSIEKKLIIYFWQFFLSD